MAELFASGRVIDAIIAFMVVECALLLYLRRKHGIGLSSAALIVNLASGAALLLSLRAALIGSAWQIISGWLVLALLAHVTDLKIRWATQCGAR